MLIVIFSLTILLTVGYVILILLLCRGLFFLKSGKNRIQYDVSVVIAARNETENIGNCLQALVNQCYPIEKYEIIVVDDRSVDNTATIVRNFGEQYSQVKLVQVTDVAHGISPKKYALEKGINSARGEIILTTDADCLPKPGWIQAMVNYFEPEVGLVAGFSPLEADGKETVFSKLLTLDSLSLAAIGASSFGIGKPLTCNGRNLAYRKVTFQSVNGFKEIQNLISGDDDLLLHLVSQKTNWKVRYAIDGQTMVRSKVPSGFKQFANQRIRHASKGRYYSNWLKFFLAGVYLFNLILLIMLAVSFFIPKIFLIWLLCWLLKSSSEFLLISQFAKLFNFKKVLTVFPLAMVLHLPYVVIFGLWGQVGKFHWKQGTFRGKSNLNC
jgi:cellulose synthase/poly-beta-1,6-N-acetylglucosamine synthase-like glycosyltransferase